MISLFFVVVLLLFGSIVMFSSSSENALSKTPDLQRPFSNLEVFSQKLHRSGPPLGRTVQTASANVSMCLSQLVPGESRLSGKFNFWVGTGRRFVLLRNL